jgi:hypothetical protein
MSKIKQKHKGLGTKIIVKSNYPNQKLTIRSKNRIKVKKI